MGSSSVVTEHGRAVACLSPGSLSVLPCHENRHDVFPQGNRKGKSSFSQLFFSFVVLLLDLTIWQATREKYPHEGEPTALFCLSEIEPPFEFA